MFLPKFGGTPDFQSLMRQLHVKPLGLVRISTLRFTGVADWYTLRIGSVARVLIPRALAEQYMTANT
jgi:hypothetical protein